MYTMRKVFYYLSKHGELAGYTSSTVSVKKGNQVSTYDEKGYLKFSK